MQQPTICVQLFAVRRLRVAFDDYFAFVTQGHGSDSLRIFVKAAHTLVVAHCRQVRTLFAVHNGPQTNEDATWM